MIDKTGKWWKGENFADIQEYLIVYTSQAYPAKIIKQSICICGGTLFRLEADLDEGCARRICTACRNVSFICDSEEFWKDAKPKMLSCIEYKNDTFEIGVGFYFTDDGKDIKWITTGERCSKCSTLGSFVDWKIDYSPTNHLLQLV